MKSDQAMLDRHPGHDGCAVADLRSDLDIPTGVLGTCLHVGQARDLDWR